MKKYLKIIIVFLFVVLGAALLGYGNFFHSTGISVPGKKDAAKSIKTERAIIKLVTIGGLKRDEAGNIIQTFGANEEAPKACPT
ncbi:MAG: hypothetical protein P8016_07890 [Sedimentisphaerales bacterium]|jgi:flagellar basal body-associated protein FliL